MTHCNALTKTTNKTCKYAQSLILRVTHTHCHMCSRTQMPTHNTLKAIFYVSQTHWGHITTYCAYTQHNMVYMCMCICVCVRQSVMRMVCGSVACLRFCVVRRVFCVLRVRLCMRRVRTYIVSAVASYLEAWPSLGVLCPRTFDHRPDGDILGDCGSFASSNL